MTVHRIICTGLLTQWERNLKDKLKKNTWFLDFYFGAKDEGRHPESKYS